MTSGTCGIEERYKKGIEFGASMAREKEKADGSL
jgi:hypothetical protein